VIDTATVVLAILVSLLKFCVLLLISGDIANVSIQRLISFGIAGTIEATIYLFMAAIFVGIIASWVSPNNYNPILNVARAISEPLLAPARNLIPTMGGLDFSPMIVLLFLQFSLRLIVAPLYNLPI
jgi:YggT family protein